MDMTELREAIERGDTEAVKAWMAVEDPAQFHSMALRWAAQAGNVAFVQMLLPRSVPTARQSEALILAATHGHLAVVDLLIPVSDPKAQMSGALQAAAEHGHLEVVNRLIPVSDPQAGNSQALIQAARAGHFPVVERLLPISNPKGQDSEALYWAAAGGHVKIVDLLLPHSDLQSHSYRALKVAELKGHTEIVQRLQQSPITIPHDKLVAEMVLALQSPDVSWTLVDYLWTAIDPIVFGAKIQVFLRQHAECQALGLDPPRTLPWARLDQIGLRLPEAIQTAWLQEVDDPGLFPLICHAQKAQARFQHLSTMSSTGASRSRPRS